MTKRYQSKVRMLEGSLLTPAIARLLCISLISSAVLLPSACSDDPVKPAQSGPDTTSQKFSQETFILGELGSLLSDVAVVNDTLAYAVGEIFKKDSVGNVEHPPYGLAIWDGKTWKLKRITARYPSGSVSIRATGIFAFSESEVWIAWGDVFRWDGRSDFLSMHQISKSPTNPNGILNPNESADKLWGPSSSNLFVVGRGGGIAHYNGTEWRRINSGTAADIQDIWGSYDEKAREDVVLCAVSNTYEISERRILRVYPTGRIDSILWRSDRRIHSIWFSEQKRIYTAGGGVFIRNEHEEWSEQESIPLYYTRRIRGVKNNDVFVSGDFGLVAHYNGVRWKSWSIPEAGILFSNDYKAGIFMTVGSTIDQKAIITIIRR